MNNATIDRRAALRLSALLLLVGQILYVIVTFLHTGGEANNHPVIFSAYAASDAWTAVHVAQFFCTAILLAGFLALFVALDPQAESARWTARFAAVSTIVAVSDSTAKSALRWLNVGLRGIMEAGIVVAFAFWGYHAASGAMAIILVFVVPAVGFGFWGAVDFHQARVLGEPLRLTQELVISGLAALALYATGQPFWGWALAITSIIHHAAVYALGGRLLKKENRRARPIP